MTGVPSRAVLRPGDWVSFEGGDHQALAFAGTSVRLRAQDGSEQVVLASYLMAAPDFAVAGGIPVPGVEPFGLLDVLPEEVLAAARLSCALSARGSESMAGTACWTGRPSKYAWTRYASAVGKTSGP